MKSVKTLFLAAAVAALTYAGFVLGIEGAQRVLMFWTWAITFPLSLMLPTDTAIKVLASMPQTPRPLRTMTSLVAWALLIALVWNGFILTGIAQFVSMTMSAWARSRADDLRTKSAAA